MSRYLIEVVEPLRGAEDRISGTVRRLGSHFVTRATWTRGNDNCTGRLIVETNDRGQALAIVPPGLRSNARVFRLESAAA